MNLWYYVHWTNKRKYFYVCENALWLTKAILAKMQKLKKSMIEHSSYIYYFFFFISLCSHDNSILPKDLWLKNKIMT